MPSPPIHDLIDLCEHLDSLVGVYEEMHLDPRFDPSNATEYNERAREISDYKLIVLNTKRKIREYLGL